MEIRGSVALITGASRGIGKATALMLGKRFIFSQPKSEKSRRTIALPPSATITLRQLREGTEHLRSRFGQVVNDTDLVFTGGIENKPLRPSTVSRAWETIAKRAGVKVIRLRDARHTHASLMLKQGVPLKVVSERLGHASISITADTYSHIAPGMQESAAKGFDVTIAHKYNKLTINDRKSVTIP